MALDGWACIKDRKVKTRTTKFGWNMDDQDWFLLHHLRVRRGLPLPSCVCRSLGVWSRSCYVPDAVFLETQRQEWEQRRVRLEQEPPKRGRKPENGQPTDAPLQVVIDRPAMDVKAEWRQFLASNPVSRGRFPMSKVPRAESVLAGNQIRLGMAKIIGDPLKN